MLKCKYNLEVNDKIIYGPFVWKIIKVYYGSWTGELMLDLERYDYMYGIRNKTLFNDDLPLNVKVFK